MASMQIEEADESAGIPDMQYKVIIIGDSGVGKTCIMLQKVKKQFNVEHTVTLGVDFLNQYYRVNKKLLALQLWDTCGQELHRSMTRVFFKGANAALLVFDVTSAKSFEMLQVWLKELRDSPCPDSRFSHLLLALCCSHLCRVFCLLEISDRHDIDTLPRMTTNISVLELLTIIEYVLSESCETVRILFLGCRSCNKKRNCMSLLADNRVLHSVGVMVDCSSLLAQPRIRSIYSAKGTGYYKRKSEQKDGLTEVMIYLVGNKIDLPDRQIERTTAEAFARTANLQGYFETSAKTAQGLHELFDSIITAAYDQKLSPHSSQDSKQLRGSTSGHKGCAC